MYMGEKVKLRAYKKEDLKACVEFINDPEVKQNLTPGIPFPFKYEDELKWFDSLNPMSEKSYSFAIETLEEEMYIGGLGINSVDWKNSVATVGIFLGKEYFNLGYGTDAMKIIIKFIFEQMNINKIKLFVYSFNKRAIRTYEKTGFRVEGVLRQEIFRNGEYHDEIIMGLLREDWKK